MDGGLTADGGDSGADGPLADFDGTGQLVDCTSDLGAALCAPSEPRERGRWHFYFTCPTTSMWRASLVAESELATLRVDALGGRAYGASSSPGARHELSFTSVEPEGTCVATVELPASSRFELELRQVEPALDLFGCDELCLTESTAGVERGCDCDRTCHDACTDLGVDCGLPCNRDVPGYACPFLESEIMASGDCTYYADDTGSFEHVGRCYRCGDGQQCCYTDGRDNGSGSYDLCPPLDPGPDDPDPNGCSGPFEHCDCDVTTLCGCMAESGDLALCGECIGEGNFDLFSCNAPGDDATFCRRALDASTAGFGWCDRVGDVTRCMERPPGF